MSLKRSISEKFKSTLVKTKTIIKSSSMVSKTSTLTSESSSSSTNLSINSRSNSNSESSISNADDYISNISNIALPQIPNKESNGLSKKTHSSHSPNNSITSIQRSLSQLLPHKLIRERDSDKDKDKDKEREREKDKDDNNIINTLVDQLELSSSIERTNLSSRKASNSLRRRGNQSKSTSLENCNINNVNNINNSDINTNLSNSSMHSNDRNSVQINDKIVLLPMDPVDKSIPPCSTEELTPIVPIAMEYFHQTPLQNPLQSFNSSDYKSPALSTNEYFDANTIFESPKKPQIISNLSNTTSTTFGTLVSNLTNSPSKNSLFDCNEENFPKYFNKSIKNDEPTSLYTDDIIQDHVDPIFIKSNQIDHFDKGLDIVKNDKLADQMALNILHNISEEQIDELSKLKEEISNKL